MRTGDYVRTKSGGIGKIIAINTNASIITDNETFGLGWDGEQVNWDFRSEIIKSSPNIIDLIEVGDYVNGVRVNLVYSPDGKQVFRIELDVDGLKGHMICESKHIKSIVTKEMFANAEYRVETN